MTRAATSRAVRAAVVGSVVVALGAVGVGYPTLLRDSSADARANDALAFADREIAGGNGVVVDQTAVYAARALIPEHAAYHVSVGPDYEGTDLTLEHVAGYYRYFLMPRRPVEGARWIVCYGCDLDAYGPGADVVWKTEADISIVRLPS